MNKRNVIFASLILLLAIAPMQVNASTENNITSNTTESAVDAARSAELTKRLDEINALDKSAMTRSEKKEARKEVSAINKEMKNLGGGVYISAGAIIIILLLIILL